MLDMITTTATAAASRPVDLTARAMLVTLSIRQWTARKIDKRVTKEVADSHNASGDVGRYNKVLIARDSLAEINGIVGAARATHAKYSLPWMQDGTRILPADAFAKYSAEMQAHREAFESAVADFLAAYPSLVDEARDRLNGLFSDDDYPTPAEIERRFAWRVDVLPMPDAADFRVDIGTEAVERIKSDMARAMADAVNSAMDDARERLFKAVRHMADKLADYRPKTDTERASGIFRDSLVDNVRELVDVLPALNLTGDAALAAAIEATRDKLTAYDAADLREDPIARAEVQEAAAAIADDMAAFMGC